MKMNNIRYLKKRVHKIKTETLQLKWEKNAKLDFKTRGHVQSYARACTLSSKEEQIDNLYLTQWQVRTQA